MARSRNIKPGFFENEDLAECSPHARLLFIGLWLIADREGRLEDRPKKVKGMLFPYEQVDIDSLLCELSHRGFVERYEREGAKCLAIPNFTKHQRPHHNESESTLPGPICDQGDKGLSPRTKALRPDSLNDECLNDESSLMKDDCLKASNEASADLPKKGKSAATPETPILSEFSFPTTGKGGDSWTLPQPKLDEYLAAYPWLDVSSEIRKARQWCRDNPRNRKTAGRMTAFLTRWLNKAQDGKGIRFPEPKVEHRAQPLTAEEIKAGAHSYRG